MISCYNIGMKHTEWIRALQAYKQEQSVAWNVDDLIIARYLAGESTCEERKVVEREMVTHPKLAECIKYIKMVAYGRS